MTAALYARRKSWPLESVTVRLRHNRIHAVDCANCETQVGMIDRIDVSIELVGRRGTRPWYQTEADSRDLSGSKVAHLQGEYLANPPDPAHNPEGRGFESRPRYRGRLGVRLCQKPRKPADRDLEGHREVACVVRGGLDLSWPSRRFVSSCRSRR